MFIIMASTGSPSTIPVKPPATPAVGPVAVKQYCDRWSAAFRGLSGEMKNLSETLVKWMAYDQGPQLLAGGSKWTKDEDEQLKRALLMYGDNMDKICKALPTRSEPAIRAAVKRKMDPSFIQQIGKLKKRKGFSAEDTSPLASYFHAEHNGGETNGEDREPTSKRSERIAIASTEKASVAVAEANHRHKTGWFLQEAGVELNDNDFLAILEEDPQIMEGAMIFTSIAAGTPAKIIEELPPVLQEKPSDMQDFIFLHNFKMPLLDLAKELHVFKPRPDVPESFPIEDIKADVDSLEPSSLVENKLELDNLLVESKTESTAIENPSISSTEAASESHVSSEQPIPMFEIVPPSLMEESPAEVGVNDAPPILTETASAEESQITADDSNILLDNPTTQELIKVEDQVKVEGLP